MIAQATALANQSNFDQAIQMLQQVLLQAPNDQQALMLTAQLMAAKGNHAQALKVIESVDTNSPQVKMAVLGQTSQWLLEMGKLNDARERLASLLQIVPDHPIANRYMFRIWNAQGRRFDSVDYTKHVIGSGDFQLSDLAMLCNIENTFRDPELRTFMERSPCQKEHILVYDARDKLISSKLEQADAMLTEALKINPNNLEAWVWFGHVKLMQEQWDALSQWLDKRPARFESHPQFWNVLGTWLLQQKHPKEAIPAFQRTLELDPRSLTATNGLSTALFELDQEELAQSFRNRYCYIIKSNNHVRNALSSLDLKEFTATSDSYEKLGDAFLADAWKKTTQFIAQQKQQPSADAVNSLTSINNEDSQIQAIDETQIGDITLQPILAKLTALDLPKTDLDQWKQISSTPETKHGVTSPTNDLKFEEVANLRGLGSAEYDWGKTAEETWLYVFRVMGGGVGVLDYDLNGYPDLYFSRAGASPSKPEQNKPKQFFRNLAGQFSEVDTQLLGLIDRGYGQGIACGDYDQDGLPDILVANIGSCTLYLNQGDGTFSASYSLSLDAQRRWTSACSLADVNRDGLPDIYVATYFGDSDYETKKCPRTDSAAQGCAPQVFPGSEDVLLINGGQHDWTAPPDLLTGIIDAGRSLGVVVGDFDNVVGNEIYVSNDASPNHFYTNRWAGAHKLKLHQSAGLAGVAVDANGRSQGSMGIAVTDIDRNGLDDIFVTNAIGEYNALYLQNRPGIFIDGSRKWNLYESSLKTVGFGCVFADMDDDSWEDLFVVNGNVDDLRDTGEGFKYLPQLYRNNGSQMTLTTPEKLQGYFEEPTLGRGLATLDFDLDHRLDFVVTHCDRNAALLQNQTMTNHHFIELELNGVQCDRDAIGARVDLYCGDRKFSDALYSGEGYYSSSEKLIHIGLGTVTTIDRMTINWPDGTTQLIDTPLKTDQRLLLVQGSAPVPR